MQFAKSFSIFFASLALLPIVFLGCGNVAFKSTTHQLKKNKKTLFSNNEQLYTYFTTGYFLMLDGDWRDAAWNFEKAIKFDRDSERIIRHLATCYFQLGENEKSIHFLEKLDTKKPEDFPLHYTLASLYEATGNRKEAITEYEHARRCKLTQSNRVIYADALYRLANIYMEEGQIDKGADCYQSMYQKKLIHDPANMYYDIGRKYFEKNNMKKAIEHFQKAKEKDPNMIATSFYLTLCYDALEKYDLAIREAKAFLEREPDNWAIRLALSGLYAKTKNEPAKLHEIEKIESILKENIVAGSENPKEYFLLCQIYRNQNKNSKAIKTIESLKELTLDNETSRDVALLLANLYYEGNQTERVEEELRIALKFDPDSHVANNFLGYFLAENNKNLDEALQLIQKALSVQPENGAYLDSLGWVYYKKARIEGRDEYLIISHKKLTEAAKHLEEPDIYDHIGDVDFSLGRWDDAINAWKHALSLYKNVAAAEEEHHEKINAKIEKTKNLLKEEKGVKAIANSLESEGVLQP